MLFVIDIYADVHVNGTLLILILIVIIVVIISFIQGNMDGPQPHIKEKHRHTEENKNESSCRNTHRTGRLVHPTCNSFVQYQIILLACLGLY